MQSRLGGRRLPAAEIQEQRIRALHERLMALVNEGYEIINVDETLFNVDHYVGSHWAHQKQPIRTTSRYTYAPKVVACSAISLTRGKVHTKYGIRSFNAQDMI